MKLLFLMAVLAAPLFGQHPADISLAPIRAEAKKAFAAEMDRAAKGECTNLVTDADVDACIEKERALSESNLAAFRAAIAKGIQARQGLFGPRMLAQFESAEKAWDAYSAKQVELTGGLVDPPFVSSSEEETQINLIRSHMRDLDKIFYILLHDNCGACLVDQ